MSFIRNLFRKGQPPPAPRSGMAIPLLERLSQSWTAHREELVDQPSSQRRAGILALWRESIDRNAHDYADLVLGHPQREQIMELEVGAIMQAYLCGVMARRGWVEKIEAQQAHFALGRALRDRLRGLGVPLETLKLTIGTVIDEALESIVQLGLENVD